MVIHTEMVYFPAGNQSSKYYPSLV